MEKETKYVGYEYMEATSNHRMESMYIDCYRNFGWEFEGKRSGQEHSSNTVLKFKRNRKLRNKAELSRLQRQFEACAREVELLERSKTATASIASFSIGLIGTALLGCSVFSYLNGLLPLMVILAIPGFFGWILPFFCYNKIQSGKARQIEPLMEQKQDEIYSLCEQGSQLLDLPE